MIKNKQGNLVSETQRQCSKCGQVFEITSKNMTWCKTCNCNRAKSATPEYKMWQRAKSRSKVSGKDFNIEISDVVIPEVCPILGIEMKHNSGKPGAYRDSYSLDRIDNTKGYIKGNVQVISQLANSMKGSADTKDMVTFAKWVLSTYNEDGSTKKALQLDEREVLHVRKTIYKVEEIMNCSSCKEAHEKFGIDKSYYYKIRQKYFTENGNNSQEVTR